MPANYWTVGKTVKLTVFGKMTTVLTPGNIVVGIGCGPANPPTAITVSAAAALIASKTNLSWTAWAYGICRSTGTSGTLSVWGKFQPHVGLVASTAQPILIPDSALTTITVDTTLATNAFVMTANRSGSTAETMTTQGLIVEALN